MIITIGGFYGSGGHELGYALASSLGYSVYGKELISESIKNSGVDLHGTAAEFYDETGEKFSEEEKAPFTRAVLSLEMDVLPIATEKAVKTITSDLTGLLASVMDTMPISYHEDRGVTKENDITKLINAQTRVVEEAAAKGDCIFLGRCASHILKGRDDVVRIFTISGAESSRRRIASHFGAMSDDSADALIQRTNRRRALYYNTFTGGKWDDLENYDYCINVDTLGDAGTLELLKKLVELKIK